MTSSPQIGQTRLGEVTYTAGEEEYADTCTLFNSAVQKRPRYVVRCRSRAKVT